ncbi:GFA family protein [Erythrobacter alti]|uniref:GFA family protein n=1 Tax=Erythrobacter alti TaxID=1896145 RepID=UPI0030F3D573
MGRDSIEGHCLCGAVRVTLFNPKDHVEVCHCHMCRRTGGAYYGALEGAGFTFASEEHVGVYRSSEWAERGFCKQCGSTLFFHFLPTGNRSFAAGLFDGADNLPISKEIFIEGKVAWCAGEGDHPKQTGEEVIAEAKAGGFTFD